ncbi:MAG TPA: XdhC family protein [Candidatus Binatia bacterium]|nr:XdhC family protein [Candidatus Binatia bacterium]
MRDIWLELKRLVERAEQGALVTVVRTEGSAYQREGTKMLFRASGEGMGTISGGCLETDLYEHCRAVIHAGSPQVVTYSPEGMMDTVFGVGTGCLGTLDVLVEPFSGWSAAHELLGEIARRTELGEKFAVVTLLREDGELALPLRRIVVGSGSRDVFDPRRSFGAELHAALVEAATRALAEAVRRPSRPIAIVAGGHRYEALVDVFVPPLRLLMFGAGEDARPLAAIAERAGVDVTVLDWRRELLDRERFPEPTELVELRPEEFPGSASLAHRPAVLLMSHHYEADRAVLGRILALRPSLSYLGILGPRSRTERLFADLGASAHPLARTPAGLDIGADTPGEIAVSIVAEILAAAKGRGGGVLSERKP